MFTWKRHSFCHSWGKDIDANSSSFCSNHDDAPHSSCYSFAYSGSFCGFDYCNNNSSNTEKPRSLITYPRSYCCCYSIFHPNCDFSFGTYFRLNPCSDHYSGVSTSSCPNECSGISTYSCSRCRSFGCTNP